MQELPEEVVAEHGGVHLLVNNAGVTWSEDIDQFSEKAWDKVVDLDAKSPFFLTQRSLPLLRAAAEASSLAQGLCSLSATFAHNTRRPRLI